MSTNLTSLYKYYNIMKMYGDYSTFEIDDMYPFERGFYHGLLLEEKEKSKPK